MTEQQILDFQTSTANMSVEELQNMKLQLDDSLTKMILDSDLMFKIAIVTAALHEKGVE